MHDKVRRASRSPWSAWNEWTSKRLPISGKLLPTMRRRATSLRFRLGVRLGAAAEKARLQHRNDLAILLVARAELRNQLSLLEPRANEDVCGGHNGEQQMSRGHVRRRPEGEQEAQHQRMTD